MSSVIVIISFISSFIIGLVLGGAIIFFFRRMSVNRLFRVAQRRATKIGLEAKEEAGESKDEEASEKEI